VTEEDAALGARLVLPQRARSLPASEPDASKDSRESPREDRSPEGEDERPEENAPDTAMPDDLMVEAVAAALPPDLLARLQDQQYRQRRQSLGGRMGNRRSSPRRGRPVGVRQSDDVAGRRLNILATLKAAAPWQTLRRRAGPRSESGALALRKEDLHVSRFEERVENTTVFVVDASGSQAAQRLAEVKGAIELLLKDCYVRRDQVALIAFRGTSAGLILPPTRALARAKRSLAGLPGGGGTPLAAGLDLARQVADAIARSGRVPSLVLMTDGRANVARDETPGAERAETEALAAARLLGAEGYRGILVDTARRPRPRAQAIAKAMGAAYVPLPRADAVAISHTVQRSVA
jgi:magnesium chelatase subunit D